MPPLDCERTMTQKKSPRAKKPNKEKEALRIFFEAAAAKNAAQAAVRACGTSGGRADAVIAEQRRLSEATREAARVFGGKNETPTPGG